MKLFALASACLFAIVAAQEPDFGTGGYGDGLDGGIDYDDGHSYGGNVYRRSGGLGYGGDLGYGGGYDGGLDGGRGYGGGYDGGLSYGGGYDGGYDGGLGYGGGYDGGLGYGGGYDGGLGYGAGYDGGLGYGGGYDGGLGYGGGSGYGGGVYRRDGGNPTVVKADNRIKANKLAKQKLAFQNAKKKDFRVKDKVFALN
ncbi:hypothetical protein IWQ60_005754 [Tieghemiomyces parasiticus]|uniref:Uncharacterized protein n=1 Tax=Tieghemiomyces parasiticus TaxID=78921 RepID=A0A9W8DXY7_9FUNG|nr:hypothetical protein IWQ60_005754 [Tieghemiomyces parasiticus]